ncbi:MULTISPECIES: tetratricopeptide repeat protein [unclassified Pseudodesulfovibrio]|uniref:tetratricopeptide repeat protein n=1 Tax=unclassified Pseudodesulfovibrio TaxID=2661612 RepID=UPI000FEBD86E|nr:MULTISPECIES: tetratricopeptide repeat protein [unclassified Pseudodesulfovibrio]MCJ2163776.1 tetratricopeptide repeat protein [Pseudodesulfovibrio sp. S3-i]RWU05975.1 outer membrane protein assembly factor BamD [Pseudodesulfovibrio sp. S3]
MNKIFKYLALTIIVAMLFSMLGCASKTDMQAIQYERQQDLSRIRQLETELSESKQLLQEKIEKSNSPIREKSADMWAEIQSLRAELARLRGEMDSLNIRMDRQVGGIESAITVEGLAEKVDEIEFALENQLQVDLPKVREERTATLSAAQNVSTRPQGAPAETVDANGEPIVAAPAANQPAEATPSPADTDPAKALYDKAYDLYKEGQFEKARSYWAEFTDTFKGHTFIPSAVFWQGQCYYKLKDYARAVILYEDVIEKYTKSSKYKAALLKAGYSWEYLGKPELAKMRLGEVVKKFPESVEATQAKRSLEKMK